MDFSQFLAGLFALPTLPADRCGCPLCRKIKAARQMFEASMLLVNQSPAVIAPTADEWIGINRKEMEGEL